MRGNVLVTDEFGFKISGGADAVRVSTGHLTGFLAVPVVRLVLGGAREVCDSTDYGLLTWTKHQKMLVIAQQAEEMFVRNQEIVDESQLLI